MKTKKIKLVKLFKIGIILFSSSLLLWNCEKEQLDESYQPKTTLEKIQSSFNKEDFKKVIPYEFEVIWKDNKKQYSDELKTTYHQFDLSYTSLLTPYINYTKKKKGDYHKSYKLIVTVDKKQQLNFYFVFGTTFVSVNATYINSAIKNSALNDLKRNTADAKLNHIIYSVYVNLFHFVSPCFLNHDL